MREEIGVHEHGVWRNEGGVVLEEEGGGDLWNLAHDFIASALLSSNDFGLVFILFEAGVSLTDDSLDLVPLLVFSSASVAEIKPVMSIPGRTFWSSSGRP